MTAKSKSRVSESTTVINRDMLPKSVRGAAPEIRPLIRRKQNAESARRCRQKNRIRRQIEAARNAPLPVPVRLQRLTALISTLQNRLLAVEDLHTALLARASGAAAQPPPPNSVSTHSESLKTIPYEELCIMENFYRQPLSPTDISVPFNAENVSTSSNPTFSSLEPTQAQEDFAFTVDELALL